MARWQPFPVVGGSYADDAKSWTVQDTVNYLVVMAERPGGRSPSMLRGVPGMRLFCDLGGDPVRGMHNAEGLLVVVSGNTLYKVASDGTSKAVGEIPGVRRCSMSHNQVKGGNQVCIANGVSGYVFDTRDESLTHITDDAFPGAASFGFLDGYMTVIEPGHRYAFTSMLADALNYNALDRYQAEASPDKLVGQAITHREWWLFGTRTIEPFVDTGANTGTFQRAGGTVIEVGCASGDSIATMDNTVYWLGNDGVVYRANGYTPQRISTHAIEQAISRCMIEYAFAFTFESRGHSVYYLTFLDGQTWGYDAASGQWHRRQSEGLDRWRVNDLTKCYGQWIAGDYSNGKLYTLDWDVQDENGDELERRRITGVLSDSQNAVIVNGLELVIDTGATQPPAIGISGRLPENGCGQPVTYAYSANGGTPPYTFHVASGTLPEGLILHEDGSVTGEMADGGEYAWTVVVVDQFHQKALLTEDRTGYDGFWNYLTSQIYPVFVQDDADSPLVTGGSVENLRMFGVQIEEALVTGGSVTALSMTKTVDYATYDWTQDDADSPLVTGGSVTALTMTKTVSHYDHAPDDADSPLVTGGSVQALTMAVVAGYQTYDWAQDDADSPVVTGGSVTQLSMTTV